MTLHFIGQQLPLLVTGTFSDGSTADVTESRNTTYLSNNTAVTTVDTHGLVTSISRGATDVIVHNGTQSADVRVAVVTGPALTVTASPSTLWPPNGSMVSVGVSGVVESTGGGIRQGSGRFQVGDEYGSIQPKGTVVLAADGSYSFTVLLEASRRGDDTAGRHYTITVSAKDNSGNPGSTSTTVLVPHDQGH
jgi:hypothetical protein